MLRFLVPILYPDKPTTCTLKLMKALYGAYSGERVCGWQHILHEVVKREVAKIGSKKGCPLAPFIYHLYARYGILTTREKEAWRSRQDLEETETHVDREPEPEEEGLEDTDREVIDLEGEPKPRSRGRKRRRRARQEEAAPASPREPEEVSSEEVPPPVVAPPGETEPEEAGRTDGGEEERPLPEGRTRSQRR